MDSDNLIFIHNYSELLGPGFGFFLNMKSLLFQTLKNVVQYSTPAAIDEPDE